MGADSFLTASSNEVASDWTQGRISPYKAFYWLAGWLANTEEMETVEETPGQGVIRSRSYVCSCCITGYDAAVQTCAKAKEPRNDAEQRRLSVDASTY